MSAKYTRREKWVLFLLNLAIIIGLIFGGLDFYHQKTEIVPKVAGIYREGIVGMPSKINPLYAALNETDLDISSLVFSGLTKYSLQEKKVVADLAEGWQISEDGLTYTFIIRQNARWHDGRPVSADDVVFTFQDILQANDFNGPNKSIWQGIKVNKKDDLTVEFVLSQPDSFFLRDVSLGILPKHILGNTPPAILGDSNFNKLPIGTGPYKVKKSDDSHLTLVRFKEFYGEKPYLKELRLFFYEDFVTLEKNADNLDAIKNVPKEELDNIKRMGFNLYPLELPQYVAAFFNNDSPLLQNKAIRQGLKAAIDKNRLTAQITNIRLLSSPAFLNLENQDVYDLGMAKEFLDQTPYLLRTDVDPNIRSNEEGNKLSLNLVTLDKSDFVTTAKALQEDWLKASIATNLLALNQEEIVSAIKRRSYDILVYGQNLGSDLDIYPYWHSSQATSGLNLANYANIGVDKRLDDVRRALSGEEHYQLLQKVEKQILDDVPAVLLYTPTTYFAVRPEIKNITLNILPTLPDRFLDLPNWYMATRRALKR